MDRANIAVWLATTHVFVIATFGMTESESFPSASRIGIFPLPVPVFLVAAVPNPRAVILLSI